MPEPTAAPVAVIGAGLAGATVARALRNAGHPVVVLDKGRGPGGRFATRRVEIAGIRCRFDHGTPALPGACAVLDSVLRPALDAGDAAPWPCGPSTDAVVGVPGMNAIVRSILGDIAPRFGVTVRGLTRRRDGWHLALDGPETAGPFRAVIVTAPAPQAAALLEGHAPALAAHAASATVHPDWAVMMAFSDAAGAEAAAARLAADDDVGAIALEGTKPGRQPGTLVVHLTQAASARRLEDEADRIAADIRAMLPQSTKLLHCAAHRWRYARVTSPTPPTLFDLATGLGAAGDWCDPAGDAAGALRAANACVAALTAARPPRVVP
ncbi:MAG: FAD-dependent oxidoreductase [Pseudomonadota bacterium]